MTRQGSDGRPAALPARLRKRADFLRAAKGVKSHRPAFVLQMAACPDADAPSALGYTLTKKVGDAVARNRMRRRLKEAVRLSPDLALSPAAHYVLVGRPPASNQDFEALKADLADAFRETARRAARPKRKPDEPPG